MRVIEQPQINKLLKLAAYNNAEWCDIICNSHNVPGVFTDGIWLNSNQVPMYYPNAVTLESGNASQVQYKAIKELITKRDGSFSVKDSFANLDLSTLGFKKLFDAKWLLAPELDNDNTVNQEIDIRLITDSKELVAWETAWSNGDSTSLFKSSLLLDNRVRFIAVYKNEKIVAGAIANSSEGIVGISNIFYPDNPSLYWHTFIRTINKEFSNKSIVGYEQGEDLTVALDAGCKSLGPLAVWVLDARLS